MTQRIWSQFGHKSVSILTAISYLFSTFSTCFAEIPYVESDGFQEKRAGWKGLPFHLEEQFAGNHWVFKVTQEGEEIHLSAYERFEETQFVERFRSQASQKDMCLRGFAFNKSYEDGTHNQLHLRVDWDGTLHVEGIKAQQQSLGFYSFGAIQFEDRLQAKGIVAIAPEIVHRIETSKVKRFDVWGNSFLNMAKSSLGLEQFHLHQGHLRNEGTLHFQGKNPLLNLQGQAHELYGTIQGQNLKVKSQNLFTYGVGTFDLVGKTTLSCKQAVTLSQELHMTGSLRVKAPQVTLAKEANIFAKAGAELHSTTLNAVEGTRIYGKIRSEGVIIGRGNTNFKG